jgi:hypothetical protein
MDSTYKVVTDRQGPWISYGAVSFADKDVVQETGEGLLAGYYPCSGATFEVIEKKDGKIAVPDVYTWNGAKLDKMNPIPDPLPKERPLRTLRMRVTNPGAVVDVSGDPNARFFPPQVLIDQDFIDEFEKLIFTEISDAFMVSTPMILTEINFRNRKGEITETRREIHSIVFVMGQYTNKDGKVGMTQRVIWDGIYRAMYGCC